MWCVVRCNLLQCNRNVTRKLDRGITIPKFDGIPNCEFRDGFRSGCTCKGCGRVAGTHQHAHDAHCEMAAAKVNERCMPRMAVGSPAAGLRESFHGHAGIVSWACGNRFMGMRESIHGPFGGFFRMHAEHGFPINCTMSPRKMTSRGAKKRSLFG